MNMMKYIFRGFLLMMLFALSIQLAFAQTNAKVRFVHVVPLAPAVDIYVDGAIAVEALEFGKASPYINLPAGQYVVSVTVAGQSNVLWEQNITADAERPSVLIAADGQQFVNVVENLGSLNNLSRLTLVHAIADAPAVDVKLAQAVELGGVEQAVGTAIASNMAYGTSFGSFDIPAQNYVVNVSVAGTDTVLVSDVNLALSQGVSNIAVVYGSASNPGVMVLSSVAQAPADSGLVRFVHAVNGAVVDIYDGETLIVPNFGFGQATEHLPLASGDHTITISPVGTTDVIATADIVVDLASAQTAVIMETPGAAVVAVATDNIGDAINNPNAVVISVTNAVLESTINSALLGDAPIAATVAFGETSDAVTVEPVVGAIDFNLTLGSDTGDIPGIEMPFYGGTYYNVVAVPGGAFAAPELLVFATSLTTTLGSTANAGTKTLAVVEPTAVAVQETPAQSAVATQAPAVAVSTVDPKIVIGRVLLDPGANLQLRQNPNADALSLGLAPSGTELVVNGREGAPVALVEGQEPPAEAATWVDPVGELPDEKTDLDPTLTWLNVTYNTPDGGQITSWVNAQFLELRNGKGEKVLLRDLDLVGGNIPGSAQATAITPPPIPEDTLTALVVNLDPGIFLNIRRFPTVDAEVIGKVPVNTTLVFVGMAEDDLWAFVEYTTPEGGLIDGWATTQYLEYQYNGKKYDLEAFKNIVSKTTSQALFEIVATDVGGEALGNVSQIAVPTVNPLKDQFVALVQLDSGANLQLRRLADATSESLNLIPSGTQLIITSRDETGVWLKVTFEGEEGWISAEFVQITFNGTPVNLDQIPVEVVTP